MCVTQRKGIWNSKYYSCSFFQNGAAMPILKRILYMIIMSIMMEIAYISFSIDIFEIKNEINAVRLGKRVKKGKTEKWINKQPNTTFNPGNELNFGRPVY